jgi:hypothetical protein
MIFVWMDEKKDSAVPGMVMANVAKTMVMMAAGQKTHRCTRGDVLVFVCSVVIFRA